jgi:hypothetical protein
MRTGYNILNSGTYRIHNRMQKEFQKVFFKIPYRTSGEIQFLVPDNDPKNFRNQDLRIMNMRLTCLPMDEGA